MLGMFCLCQRPVTAHGCSRCPLWQPCAATGRWHYSIVRTMTPWNHALRVSFVCSKAWVVCSCLRFVGIVATATVVLQHSSKFVATIAVTARLKFVWQGSVYIWCCGEGVGGGNDFNYESHTLLIQTFARGLVAGHPSKHRGANPSPQ